MYKIADILIDVKNMIQSLYSERLDLFEVNGNKKADTVFDLYITSEIEPPCESSIFYANNQFIVVKKKDLYIFYYHFNGYIYAKVEEYNDGINNIYIVEKLAHGNLHPYLFPSLLRLEKYLIEKNSGILHSSYVIYNNQSILFSAPSGGGKSTQAELWKKYKNAIIANGDKSIICKENDKWYSCGIPFSGSSDYCLNIKKPLSAIILLEKGLENKIERVDLKGFNRVYSQMTVNPWDKEFCNKILDLTIDICTNVPVYIYSCTKEEDAVDYLYNYLVEEGILNGIF